MTKLIETLGLYKAIKNTAKKYHWKTVGATFMSDHLLFDRIYNDIDEGLIDKIVEQYYMGIARSEINDLDDLCKIAVEREGRSYEAKSENIVEMFKEISTMMVAFLQAIQEIDKIRGINAELDNMASVVSQLHGLVTARIS